MGLRLAVLMSFATTLALGCAPPLRPTPRVTTADQVQAVSPDATFAHVRITEGHLVVDDEIQFAPNSDVIQPASYALLEEIAQVLKVHREIGRLDVVAHGDTAADEPSNHGLSQRRAAAVAEALRQAGVLTLIDVRGASDEETPCAHDSDECTEQARRVEFVVKTRDEASG